MICDCVHITKTEYDWLVKESKAFRRMNGDRIKEMCRTRRMNEKNMAAWNRAVAMHTTSRNGM